jgi:hypothetical protein
MLVPEMETPKVYIGVIYATFTCLFTLKMHGIVAIIYVFIFLIACISFGAASYGHDNSLDDDVVLFDEEASMANPHYYFLSNGKGLSTIKDEDSESEDKEMESKSKEADQTAPKAQHKPKIIVVKNTRGTRKTRSKDSDKVSVDTKTYATEDRLRVGHKSSRRGKRILESKGNVHGVAQVPHAPIQVDPVKQELPPGPFLSTSPRYLNLLKKSKKRMDPLRRHVEFHPSSNRNPRIDWISSLRDSSLSFTQGPATLTTVDTSYTAINVLLPRKPDHFVRNSYIRYESPPMQRLSLPRFYKKASPNLDTKRSTPGALALLSPMQRDLASDVSKSNHAPNLMLRMYEVMDHRQDLHSRPPTGHDPRSGENVLGALKWLKGQKR